MGHNWKNTSHFKKWVILRKRGHNSKYGQLVQPKKIVHFWKNESHLEKWLTLGNMGYTRYRFLEARNVNIVYYCLAHLLNGGPFS